MRRVLSIFLLGMFAVLSVRASDCGALLGTCDYYQCLEMREQCGSDGYYLKFGKHYCEKYQADEANYSEKGREFLANIRTCLQEELEREQIRANEFPRCSKVEKFAVGTHKYCYQQYGFCDLPRKDRRHIKLTAKKELIHFRMLLFGFWLEKACIGD
ncbi:hypothetical protein [Pseudobdellovibrio sp. HCB154]|uniref:hypothetical protein n=1 Tax=Pseudobdellovibrio sp. HCB154 TaxID=3386277 RepID=UPI003916E5D3